MGDLLLDQLGVVKKALTDLSNSVEIFWVASSRNKKGGGNLVENERVGSYTTIRRVDTC